MRSHFDEQLALLNQELTQMGELCELAIELVVGALTKADKELAQKVAPISSEIDQKERGIESLCLKLLLQQQPVARDLRQISAVLKMITDMERIGDQAEDIAEIFNFMETDSLKNKSEEDLTVKNRNTLCEMAKAAIQMVKQSIDAYVKKEITLAQKVVQDDDIVDDFFNQMKKQLIEIVAANPADGEYTIDLLMIAKYFERIADHAVNIAQWAIFSITGQHQ